MTRLGRLVGRNKDLPQLETYTGGSATAGTGSDFEHVIASLTDLTYLASTGQVGDIVSNGMSIRFCQLVFEAPITGAATNNCTFNFMQRRAGAFLVNTTSSTTIATGTNIVIPASTANLYNGQQLLFSGGTGTAETVTIYNVNATTFTANFANTHSGGYAITSAPLATITFGNNVNATAFVPIQFPRVANFIVRGDVITIQRISNGTGLATPSFYASIDWSSSGVG